MKKTAKTLLALLLAVSMLLCGCGSDEKEVSGTVAPQAGAEATQPIGTVEPIETTAPPETEPPVEETTEPEEESNLSIGRMEGGVYSNRYVGFACELDSDWTFYSTEELQQLPEMVTDMMSGSELGEALANVSQFTDMMAENVNDLTTMNVLYQKMSLQERLAYATMDDDAIADSILAQLDMMVDAYAQSGILVESMEKVTVNFLGEERVAIFTTSTIQGMAYYILQIFEFHLGEYSVTTTFASYIENKTSEMLELFYPIEGTE